MNTNEDILTAITNYYRKQFRNGYITAVSRERIREELTLNDANYDEHDVTSIVKAITQDVPLGFHH